MKPKNENNSRELFKVLMDYTMKINLQEYLLGEIQAQYMYFLNENKLDQVKKVCTDFKY